MNCEWINDIAGILRDNSLYDKMGNVCKLETQGMQTWRLFLHTNNKSARKKLKTKKENPNPGLDFARKGHQVRCCCVQFSRISFSFTFCSIILRTDLCLHFVYQFQTIAKYLFSIISCANYDFLVTDNKNIRLWRINGTCISRLKQIVLRRMFISQSNLQGKVRTLNNLFAYVCHAPLRF